MSVKPTIMIDEACVPLMHPKVLFPAPNGRQTFSVRETCLIETGKLFATHNVPIDKTPFDTHTHTRAHICILTHRGRQDMCCHLVLALNVDGGEM